MYTENVYYVERICIYIYIYIYIYIFSPVEPESGIIPSGHLIIQLWTFNS